MYHFTNRISLASFNLLLFIFTVKKLLTSNGHEQFLVCYIEVGFKLEIFYNTAGVKDLAKVQFW